MSCYQQGQNDDIAFPSNTSGKPEDLDHVPLELIPPPGERSCHYSGVHHGMDAVCKLTI
jgi:hypothetical protein